MELEALKQLLASLDINPDEIKDERCATAFRIQFSVIEKQNEEIEFLKAEIQKLRDEINLLKGEQTKPKIRGSKKNEDISSEKRDEIDGFHRTKNLYPLQIEMPSLAQLIREKSSLS
jgi:cell division protein FtsB